MYLSELQSKEVISIENGKKIGRIIDAKVNLSDSQISYFVVQQRRLFKRLFTNSSEVKFSFENVEKIGDDVILVKI